MLNPMLTKCKACGKPVPLDSFPFCSTVVQYKPLIQGKMLKSPCYGKWQAKNFEMLWRKCIPAEGWGK